MKRSLIPAAFIAAAMFALTTCNVFFHELATKDPMDKHVFVTRFYNVIFVAEISEGQPVKGYPQKKVVRMDDTLGYLPEPWPEKPGNTFVVWMIDGKKVFTGQEKIKDDITVTAEWIVLPPNEVGDLPDPPVIGGVQYWWVNFITNEGLPEIKPRLVPDGYVLARPEELTREGYNFIDWFVDAEYIKRYDFSYPVYGNQTIFAGWNTQQGVTPKQFTVRFHENGGSYHPADQILPYNAFVTKPQPNPTREDGMYNFYDWFADETSTYQWKFHADKVIADLDLYAKWTTNGIPVESLTIFPPTMTLNKTTSSMPINATITPNTAPQTVTWTSSNQAIAAVNVNPADSRMATVVATGEGGPVYITARAGNKVEICVVNVNISVTGVTLSESVLTLHRYDDNPTAGIIATVSPSTATNKLVSWKSSDDGVAYFDPQTSRIIGRKDGTVTITATTADGGKTAMCTVTVKQHVSKVELRQDLTFRRENAAITFPLEVTIWPEEARDLEVAWTYTWKSETSNAATVNASGVLTIPANGSGATDITVTVANDNDLPEGKEPASGKTKVVVIYDRSPTYYVYLSVLGTRLSGSGYSDVNDQTYQQDPRSRRQFYMGSPQSPQEEFGRNGTGINNEVHHEVIFDNTFNILLGEVTEALFDLVMYGIYPPTDSDLFNNTVKRNVSWYEAIEFCNRFSLLQNYYLPDLNGWGNPISRRMPFYKMTKVERNQYGAITSAVVEVEDWAANGWRLPTEAEWEFAACGFNGYLPTYPYSSSSSLYISTGDRYGSFSQEINGSTYTFNNPSGFVFGELSEPTRAYVGYRSGEIYNMNGNVREWVWDAPAAYEDPPNTSAILDPHVDKSTTGRDDRRVRGGSFKASIGVPLFTYSPDIWGYRPKELRNAYREYELATGRYDDVGFRIVRRSGY